MSMKQFIHRYNLFRELCKKPPPKKKEKTSFMLHARYQTGPSLYLWGTCTKPLTLLLSGYLLSPVGWWTQRPRYKFICSCILIFRWGSFSEPYQASYPKSYWGTTDSYLSFYFIKDSVNVITVSNIQQTIQGRASELFKCMLCLWKNLSLKWKRAEKSYLSSTYCVLNV